MELPTARVVPHGRGLWFRAVCTSKKCPASQRLTVVAPFYSLVENAALDNFADNLDEDGPPLVAYEWKLTHAPLPPSASSSSQHQQQQRPPPSSHHAKKPQPDTTCWCVQCGSEMIPVEANLTECYFKLDGVKIVGLDRVKYKGKWAECNGRNRRNYWEDINGPGGLHAKWEALSIVVQIGGEPPPHPRRSSLEASVSMPGMCGAGGCACV